MGSFCSRNQKEQCFQYPPEPSFRDVKSYQAKKKFDHRVKLENQTDKNKGEEKQFSPQQDQNNHDDSSYECYKNLRNDRKKLRLGYHKYFEDLRDKLRESLQDLHIDGNGSIAQKTTPSSVNRKELKEGFDDDHIEHEHRDDDLFKDNTVRNSIWDDHDTQSIMYGLKSRLLMDQQFTPTSDKEKYTGEMPSRILQELQILISQMEDYEDFNEKDDYQHEIQVLIQEIDKHFFINKSHVLTTLPEVATENTILPTQPESRISQLPFKKSDQFYRTSEKRKSVQIQSLQPKQVTIMNNSNKTFTKKKQLDKFSTNKSLHSADKSQSKQSMRSNDAESALSISIKSFKISKESEFFAFLENIYLQYQIEKQSSIQEQNLEVGIFESKIFRQPQNNKVLIQRSLILFYNQIQCHNYPRLEYQSPLFTIPIDNIKSIEMIPSNTNKISKSVQKKFETLFKQYKTKSASQNQNDKTQQHFFFKIVLDIPLKDYNKVHIIKKNAISDRIVNETADPFKDCIMEGISKEPNLNENSDYFDTIILNNDDDQKSNMFDDEESNLTQFRMSHSIRQLQQKAKGFNSQKTDYYEVFEIGCSDEVTCKKWVLTIKWLIKRHLNSIN
ncbi:UNKNOWN [Stylonychia lemnae]|uniref:PH domain-containing protein n=1 Tax=Stylonychia lemnae TaxID=5949 RepID=A0A078AK50_STYLE|nr:UNKNOWN [Stylonychia lemnae]|eukprot:CDW81832.1 UNKNOWN [Stylonychia lemnae]